MTTAIKPLTFALLRELADGRFHSGELLAQRHGISRATVNNALRDLKPLGLSLFSVQGRGYRLSKPLIWLDAPTVRQALGGAAAALMLELLDSASSSNVLLLQRATQGAPSGTVLAVEWQTAGRGRLGRTWHAALGDSLTFSLLWRFNCGLAGLAGLSLAVGVALMRALQQLGFAGVGLKWPNDVLSEQGKLAGILIEAQGDMMGPSAVVIGIGLNVRLPEISPETVMQAMGSLAQLSDKVVDRNLIFAQILLELTRVLNEFASHGFESLREEWERHHHWQNQPVNLLLPDGHNETGIMLGVTKDGALRLATEHGERIFHSGEISVRLAK
jgi:BirA family biotin operon repressor/biotin-[acetyl-CoA-carboxylase] ligase